MVRLLERDSLLMDRVEWLMTIPAVGPITALTWALEVGDVQRFSSIEKAVSYCGLCGAEKSSGNAVQRIRCQNSATNIYRRHWSGRRRWLRATARNLAVLCDKERQRGNANRATLAVARKLVAYLLAVEYAHDTYL
jgi:transposase